MPCPYRKPKSRDAVIAAILDQYQPGTDDMVLKNLLGITSREEMEAAETAELWRAEEQLLEEVEQDQSFTAEDIRAMTASFAWFLTLSLGAGLLAPLFRRPLAWRILDSLVFLTMWGIALSLIRGAMAG
jgi:hypothetical protein